MSAIVPVSWGVYWVEADTRQAFDHARVLGPSEIDVTARWASRITLLLRNRLVNLDEPLVVRVNREVVHEGTVERSMRVALEEARRLGNERRVYAARLTVPVPTTRASYERAILAWDELASTHPQGQLSFWEMYAVRALEERVPTVGFEGSEDPLPEGVSVAPEQVGVRVTAMEPGGPAEAAGLLPGDVLVSFGGEPFFHGRGGVGGLHHWLIRELRETEREYQLVVSREGGLEMLQASYVLGPYNPPGDT
ncbi:MAG: PDZ domain-containing protein [Gemmatimonadota bacterium]